jgi:hypothetical protein
LRSQKKLVPDKVAKLDRIGFQWHVQDENWLAMFDRLLAYKRDNGDLLVPLRYRKDPSLARWVFRQRTAYGFHFLEQDTLDSNLLQLMKKSESASAISRIELLDKIGFTWSIHEAQWMEMFKKLVESMQGNDPAIVPGRHEEDPKLAALVAAQRLLIDKEEKTVAERRHIKLLNSIDFQWDPFESAWQEKFERICKLKEKFGHTRVPIQSHPDDPQLGRWVKGQRRAKKGACLDAHRVEALESINFAR